MVETTTYIRTQVFCNQCENELEFYEDAAKSDLQNCDLCGGHFNAGEEIECEPDHSDSYAAIGKHWHKRCYLQHIEEQQKIVEQCQKEDAETAVKPIPPTDKSAGILGVIL